MDEPSPKLELAHQARNVLVTGGAGFIGSNLVHHLAADPHIQTIVNLDALTYAGNLDNLEPLRHEPRHHFVKGDIRDQQTLDEIFAKHEIDTVIHLAAESHVDRSIDGPAAFVETNVDGTFQLLQAARKAWKNRRDVRFHHVSTDEVFGSLGDTGFFSETTAYDPSSPYSATKAASDHLVRAWNRSFNLPATISNCSNNYGPYQFPEKLIPLMIANAIQGKPMPVYGDGRNVRDWLYVQDHCRAIMTVVRHAPDDSTWCVGGHNEQTNIGIVEAICDLMQELRPKQGGYRKLIAFVKDRPGHDRRYAIDAGEIKRQLGWTPLETFQSGLRKTVQWYLDHQNWVEQLVRRHAATQRRGTAS